MRPVSDIDKVAALLSSKAIDKQIAASIVLGELRAKGPKVVDGLRQLLSSEVPPVQRHALEALGRIGARKTLPDIFPLLTAHHEEVRLAAAQAVASVGSEVVPTIRDRIKVASSEERRVLDGILAELGGADAFSTLLVGLDTSDEEAAKAAALAIRHEVKRADSRQRHRYATQTEKFLKQKKAHGPIAVAAGIKILGYLEDQKAVPTLLEYASDAKAPAHIRQEALLALRFTTPAKDTPAEVASVLLDAASGEDRVLAHTALHTLSTLEVPAKLLKKLIKLATHPDIERSRLAIEHLGRTPGVETAEALVEVLSAVDRKRAELAATALAGRSEAAPALAKHLLAATDPDRAWLLRNVLRPFAKQLKGPVLAKLRASALDKLAQGTRGFEAALDIAREGDAKAVATDLRELAQRLSKQKKLERATTVLRLLAKSEHAVPDDLYRLASIELGQSRLDTQPNARATDTSLKLFSSLLERGFDVAAALRRDRSVDPAMQYYVGFHFAESRHPLGIELLEEVIKKGGRTKVAKMAKNKLGLAHRADEA
jgi:HEAT repeat protein